MSKVTYGDKIKSMSNDELIDFLSNFDIDKVVAPVVCGECKRINGVSKCPDITEDGYDVAGKCPYDSDRDFIEAYVNMEVDK